MGKFTEFKLPLKSLPAGEHSMSFHLDKVFFENMENTDIHGADIDVQLHINHTRDQYILDFEIKGEVVLLCDRCLDDLHFPIETSYHIVVEYGADYNDASDDLLIIPESDAFLNVAYIIYDTVVLSIPMKHVHPMGKCNRQMSAMLHKHRVTSQGQNDEDAELQQQLVDEIDQIDTADDAGNEADTDPRWDALKGLKDSDNDE